MTAWIARCGGEVSIKKLCNRDKLGNRKSMVSVSMMMDVEGIECVHLYNSNRSSSLTCPERAGGQEEIWGESVAY